MSTSLNIQKGDTFGRLTIIEEAEPARWGERHVYRRFKCLCVCGQVRIIRLSCLRRGESASCGCLARERMASHAETCKVKFIPKTRVGKLLLLWELEPAKTKHGQGRMIMCRCDCGTEKALPFQQLRSGQTKSCGCLRSEACKERSTTHGMKGSSTYRIWNSMKARCKPCGASRYHRYSGRGITVCKRWEKFENFLADMGVRPSAKHSLDRINNAGDYTPKNCRWATPHEQNNNKSNTRWVTLRDATKPQMEWCRHLGISKSQFQYRFANWSHDEILAGHSSRKKRQ